MGQQVLKTVIALSGRVDNSVGRLGDAILNIGSQVDALSQKVINFGKESVKEYVAYDDVMREVQALGEYENGVIDSLNDYNKAIAQTSRYTMEEAGHAEVLMAQLGLNLDQTKTLMPTVMDMATAANIDLADSLDYLYYTLNALGQPLDYADDMADQMSKTAAISAADINTLGESLQRLGSGAQYFSGGSSEVLAILGGISKFGKDMQGSNAGTQLRNFMLTLLAPTAGKEKLMAELGMTEEAWAEFESYMEDAGINVTDTAAAMNELGLSMYDSRGKLKPAIQILGELKTSLSSLSKEEQKEFLGKMFGKRTTITAENLLAAYETIIAYQKQIQDGSDGYTAYMAAIMDAGLGGTLRNLGSSWNALQVVVGDTLEPDVNFWATGLEGIVDSVANLDEAKLSALVGAGEGLAVAGPGLMLAGGAFKFIGWALTPAGKWAVGLTLAAAGIGALVKGVQSWQELDFESNFGTMELDSTALTEHLATIEGSFKTAYGEVNAYNGALELALQNYETASSTLSGKLTTAMITGATLTEKDVLEIQGLGSAVGTELMNGINAGLNASAASLEVMYGGLDEMETDTSYLNAVLNLGEAQRILTDKATALGTELGGIIDAAVKDSIITGDERTAILKKLQAYNEAMAEAMRIENAGELALALHDSESVSWDSAAAFFAQSKDSLDSVLAFYEDEYYRNVGQQKEAYAIRMEHAETEEERLALENERDNTLSGMKNAYDEQVAAARAKYDIPVFNALDALISDSTNGVAWDYMSALWKGGALDRTEQGFLPEGYDYASFLPKGYDAAGMYDLLDDFYGDSGALLKRLKKVLTDEQYAAVSSVFNSTDDIMRELEVRANEDQAREAIDAAQGVYDDIFSAIASGNEDAYVSAWNALSREERREYSYLVDRVAGNYYDLNEELFKGDQHPFAQDNSGYRLDYAAYKALFGGGDGADGEGVQVPVAITGSKEAAEAALAEGQAVMDAGVTVPVHYQNNPPAPGGVTPMEEYADGGRATVASIFGEAGPEWAIPEEHSARTASLLNAARVASGFTWPELIDRNGGLNAGSKSPTQIIYSPTIYAKDARGVEQKLIEDKERLDRWWAEKQLRDEVEVYV